MHNLYTKQISHAMKVAELILQKFSIVIAILTVFSFLSERGKVQFCLGTTLLRVE